VSETAILAFVSAAFSSLWPMEVMLVLCQEPGRGWTIDALARELRANIPVVTQGLAALQAVQFVTVDHNQAYRFQPTPERAEVARALIDLYNLKPRAVMRAIFSAPADRIQTFADAFRLRKDSC
jgi:hypothetical protein